MQVQLQLGEKLETVACASKTLDNDMNQVMLSSNLTLAHSALGKEKIGLLIFLTAVFFKLVVF